MGRASRRKREPETEETPDWVDLVVHAGVATATGEGGAR